MIKHSYKTVAMVLMGLIAFAATGLVVSAQDMPEAEAPVS